MFVRAAAVLTAITFAAPALAEPLNAEAARHFVAGKLFSFSCFEGTTGSGRIFADGSVAGVVRTGGGNTRFMHLPPGTLFPKGAAICSQIKGALFNPCFDLTKTSDKSFRGAVSGLSFAYCDFTRRNGRDVMQASITPEEGSALVRSSIRRTRKPHRAEPTATASVTPSAPVAAPVKPVTSEPLPAIEPAGIRSSIAP
jgi:hypothetical protein